MTAWRSTALRGGTRWKESPWPAGIEVMTERQRRRQLPTLPPTVQQLILLAGGAAKVPSSGLLAASVTIQ
jgi:hypothetical protein